MNKALFFVFSNKTHFETALPILEYFQDKYDYVAIFNLSNPNYSKGLREYLEKYRELFQDILVLNTLSSKIERIKQLLQVKKFVQNCIKTCDIQSSIQFIEGSDIDWLVIGVLKENNIRTVVLQWGITWEPSYYDGLHGKNTVIKKIKSKIHKVIKIVLGLNYPSMKYLGDGQSDYLLTMGDFWTNQFLKYHNKKDKFISVGNPRFLDLVTLKEHSNKKDILFITGAGTSLYGYGSEKHLEDIKNVYSAYVEANIPNILIHKIHPRDKFAIEIEQLAKKYKNIKVEISISTTELLKNTMVTIVIRSTVGLEALISGSKLVIYNNGNQSIGFNYANYGLATEVSNNNELKNLLINIESIKQPSCDEIEYYIKTKDIMKDLEYVITKN